MSFEWTHLMGNVGPKHGRPVQVGPLAFQGGCRAGSKFEAFRARQWWLLSTEINSIIVPCVVVSLVTREYWLIQWQLKSDIFYGVRSSNSPAPITIICTVPSLLFPSPCDWSTCDVDVTNTLFCYKIALLYVTLK